MAASDEIDQYLTTEEVAAKLRISPGTLRNWLSRNIIPYHRIGGRVLLRPADVNRFLQAGYHPALDIARKR